ncbi:MAG: hypothetical protein ACOVLE_06870 [Pirellula staleyi]
MSVKYTEQSNMRRKQGWIRATGNRLALLFVLASATTQFTGCTAWTGINNSWKYNGYWNNTMMGQRNRSSASKAWHSRKHHFCNEKYLKEFSAGFKAGYADVADGGTGCSPAFPPREYWGWKYQSCEGQARVAAWFSGFPHGARAAEEEGIGTWTQIQTSSNIQHEYANNGMLNKSAAGMYPVAQSAIPNGMPSRESNAQPPIDLGQTYPVSIGEEQYEVTNMPSLIQQ